MDILFVSNLNEPEKARCNALKQYGFTVKQADINSVTAALDGHTFDLLLLASSSLVTGVLLRTHRLRPKLPTLVLCNASSSTARAQILNAGADDCIAASTPTLEIVARIKALHRRVDRDRDRDTSLKRGTLCLQPKAFKLTVDGREQPLSRCEFTILQALMENGDAIVSRRQLEQQVYRRGSALSSNVLDVHICHLRKKLGDKALIRTIRGVGYSISP